MKTLMVVMAAAAGALLAAPPALQEISPRGAQRGKNFTLYLRGDGLLPNARIQSTLPATFSRMTLSKDPAVDPTRPMRANALLPFLVTLKAEAAVGLYPIRVITPEGISNVLLFSVSDLPEVEEKPTGRPGEAQAVNLPVVINGKLAGPEIDQYTFHANAGQKLVFEVEARRAGSAIDPAIEVLDAAGHEIARNDDDPALGVDARLALTFPKAGEYRVAIHDSKFSEQAQNFYRLKIASFEYADAIFPLGGSKGTEVTLSGGNLARPVKVKAESGEVRIPGSASLPLRFALSERKELLEPGELADGAVMNGRISRPGEIDRYRLRVAPGEQWVFEMSAASLGTSRLDAILTVTDAQGKKLAAADDGNGFDPVLPFTVPKNVQEVVVSVEDLLGRGGDAFGYRLQARRGPADFAADLLTPFVNVPAGGTARVSVFIQRRGYDGDIRLRIPNLPAGFTMAGGHVPSEAAAQDFKNDNPGRRTAVSVITITAPADAKPMVEELEVVAEARTADGVIRRPARGPGMVTAVRGDRRPVTAPWLGAALPMAVTSPPPLIVTPGTLLARFAQGFEFEMQYEVKRTAAAKGALKVTPQILGSVGNLRILKGTPGKNPDKGVFLMDTNFATPFTTFDMAFEAQTEIDGKPVAITSPVMSFEVVPGYEITLAQNEVEIAPGGQVRIPGKVRREPTFEGDVIKVQAEDLPDNVKCAEVAVPADSKEFVLACEAAPETKSGAFAIRITSVAPNTGRKAKQDYRIPDVAARLMVAGARVAAQQRD
jgi:hypothetical protein